MEVQWNQLKETADRPKGFKFTPPLGEPMPTRIAWKDRLKESFLSGALPLLLLLLVVLGWMMDGATSVAAMVGTAPLLVWFCRPLLTQNGVGRLARMLFALPLLVFFSAAAMLLPTVGLYHSKGEPLHKEILAVTFQNNLEDALTWPALVSFVVVLGLIGFGIGKVESKNPWLQPTERSSFSIGWRVLVLLVMGAAALFVHGRSYLGEREKAWLEEQERFYLARPFRTFPPQTEDEFWRTQLVTLNEGREYPLILLKDHPPANLDEVDAAESYLFRLLPHNRPDPYYRSLAALDFVQINLQLRPNGNRAYLSRVLSKLVELVEKSELSEEQLLSIRERALEVEAEIFDRLRELDQEAYRTLWAEGTSVEPDQPIGWYSPEEVLSWQQERRMGWTYNGVTRPTPLKAFGYEIEWSPTLWLARLQRAELTREWVGVRDELLKLEIEKQRESLAEQRDRLGHLDSREYQFWDSQAREDQVTLESYLIKKLITGLDSKLDEAKGGR